MTFGVIFLGARKCDLLLDMLQSIHDHDLRNLTTHPNFMTFGELTFWRKMWENFYDICMTILQNTFSCRVRRKFITPKKFFWNVGNPDPSGFMSHYLLHFSRYVPIHPVLWVVYGSVVNTLSLFFDNHSDIALCQLRSHISNCEVILKGLNVREQDIFENLLVVSRMLLDWLLLKK